MKVLLNPDIRSATEMLKLGSSYYIMIFGSLASFVKWIKAPSEFVSLWTDDYCVLTHKEGTVAFVRLCEVTASCFIVIFCFFLFYTILRLTLYFISCLLFWFGVVFAQLWGEACMTRPVRKRRLFLSSVTSSILICVVLWTQAKRVIPSSITVSVTRVLMAGPVRIGWMDITVIAHLVSNDRKRSGWIIPL